MNNFFHKSALVVAHPDDEILWFSSIVDKVDIIIFCFIDFTPQPAIGSGRRKVISDYPLSNVLTLDLTEAGSFNGADWTDPKEDNYGLDITSNKDIAVQYRNNFHSVHERLSRLLDGYQNIYTHNPWGEYGHEDHVQVYRVLESIKKQQGFNLWFSNYGGNRSSTLMLNYISGFHSRYISFSTNPELVKKISYLYKKYKCWTWYDDYEWFNEECFINDPDTSGSGNDYGHLFPINYIKTNFPTNENAADNRGRSLFKKI